MAELDGVLNTSRPTPAADQTTHRPTPPHLAGGTVGPNAARPPSMFLARHHDALAALTDARQLRPGPDGPARAVRSPQLPPDGPTGLTRQPLPTKPARPTASAQGNATAALRAGRLARAPAAGPPVAAVVPGSARPSSLSSLAGNPAADLARPPSDRTGQAPASAQAISSAAPLPVPLPLAAPATAATRPAAPMVPGTARLLSPRVHVPVAGPADPIGQAPLGAQEMSSTAPPHASPASLAPPPRLHRGRGRALRHPSSPPLATPWKNIGSVGGRHLRPPSWERSGRHLRPASGTLV